MSTIPLRAWCAVARQAELVDSGLPLLREQAEIDGPAALRRLEEMYARALALLPPPPLPDCEPAPPAEQVDQPVLCHQRKDGQ